MTAELATSNRNHLDFHVTHSFFILCHRHKGSMLLYVRTGLKEKTAPVIFVYHLLISETRRAVCAANLMASAVQAGPNPGSLLLHLSGDGARFIISIMLIFCLCLPDLL